MAAPIWVALIALIAACIGPLITYIAANRKLSGKINTSEAASLWTESASIREEYRNRLDKAEERIMALEKRSNECEQRNNSLEQKIMDLNSNLVGKEKIIDTLRESNEELFRQMTEFIRGYKGGRGT